MFRRRQRSASELFDEARRLDLLGHDGPSVALYEQAAAAGSGAACNELGKRRVRAGNTIEGLRLLRRAVDAGVPEASLNLAAVYTRRGQLAKAAECRAQAEPGLRDLAATGDANAALALRRLYRDRDDPPAADAVVEAYAELAKGSTDPEVWCGLGVLLDDAVRTSDAIEWWRRGAEAGHIESMYLLGLVLGESDWLRRAADAGNAYAMGSLGEQALAEGDERAAGRWRRKAAKVGLSADKLKA